ncbi:MAG: hypothetical protein JNG88_16185, partial [Phycisphaerales bacterium]|nr:hypothetical protein [Phycisphaerales bacterium]
VTAIEHTIDGGDGGGRAPQYATRVMLESPEVRTEFDIAHRQVWAKRGTLMERSE